VNNEGTRFWKPANLAAGKKNNVRTGILAINLPQLVTGWGKRVLAVKAVGLLTPSVSASRNVSTTRGDGVRRRLFLALSVKTESTSAKTVQTRPPTEIAISLTGAVCTNRLKTSNVQSAKVVRRAVAGRSAGAYRL